MDYSFFYVSGFPNGLFEGSGLIAERDADTIAVFTSPLEEDIAKANSDGIVVHTDYLHPRDDMKKFARKKVKTIGINARDITFESLKMIRSTFKGAKVIDVSSPIARARCVKDDSEIEAIRKACDIASKAYSEVPDLLKDGTMESEIAAELAYKMQKAGGSGVSFESIVSFGKNSAFPHYTAGEARLRKGQFVLLDYGAKFHRYCSDITRTLVHGSASAQQKLIYNTVKEANAVGIDNCLAGKTGAEVHKAAAKIIDSTEFKGRFIHSLGHSLGLAVHDPGVGLSLRSHESLEPGMVLTIEPGIYLPSLGGVRIEDDVLITKSRPRVLTTSTRDLIEA